MMTTDLTDAALQAATGTGWLVMGYLLTAFYYTLKGRQ